MYRITGSLAFVAAARCVLAVTKDQDDNNRRLVLSVKNNLAEDTSGLAYRVVRDDQNRPRVEWEQEPIAIAADDAMAADQDERTDLSDAVEFLKELLANGPLPAKEVRRHAEDAGHAWRTIRRAKERAGVTTRKEGGRFGGGKQRWVWALKGPTSTEGVHHRDVDTFCKVGPLQQTADVVDVGHKDREVF